MKKSILFAGMAAIIMSSCTNNELDFGGSDAGSKLQVSASIHEMQTRAGDTSWDKDDAIGVSDDGTNTNVKYVTSNGDGVFSSDQTIYLLGDESHSFTAYYPYSESVTSDNKEITFTQPADFMYGTATATRQSPNAAFTFTHKMSELSFTVKDASSSSSTEAKASTRGTDGDDASSSATSTSTITLHNVILGGKFDTSTGTVTPGTTTGDYTVNFTLDEKTSIILPPQTFTDNKVEITVTNNGKTYGGTLSLEKSEESKDIQYQLTINKENESKALNISSSTITGWTAIEKGNQDLEEKEAENVLEIGDFLLSDGTTVDKAYDLTKLTDKKVVGVVYYVGNAQPSVLYTDYTSSQDILSAEAPKATNGLAIAINNANDGTAARLSANVKYDYSSSWFVESNTNASKYIKADMNMTSESYKILGYNNTAIIEAAGETTSVSGTETTTGSSEFMTILSNFRTANAVPDNCSKWYLPSFAELKQIQDNYSVISASITKAGGSLAQFSDYVNGTTTKPTENFYWSSTLRGGQNAWISPLAETADQLFYITRTSNSYKGYFRFVIAF